MADGFTIDDYDPVEVWPECWRAWCLFCELAGQWRIAPSGQVIALDYAVLYTRMDRLRLDDETWEEVYEDIAAIEGAAIKAINAKART